MKIDKAQITGLILAGGQGTRMGGLDKGLQLFRGQAMVQQVLARLCPQVGPVLLSANRNLAEYRRFGVPVLADELGGFAGPLAGLQAGLRHCGTDYLLLAPCDSPCLPADLAPRLAEALAQQGADLASAVTGAAPHEQAQPVFCLLKTALLPRLEEYLLHGGRKLESWFATLNAVRVHFDDEAAFCNLNTPDDLRRYEAAPVTLAAAIAATAGYDAGAMHVAQARAIIGAVAVPVMGEERMPLMTALGRVLAHDVISPIDVPAHPNSAMDGYALRGADLEAQAQTCLRVIGSAFAGHPFDGAVAPGACVRIMTGAVMPPDCDTVIPQEHVRQEGQAGGQVQQIVIAVGAVQAGDNRRLAGEDLAAGALALRAGKRLRPADIGLLASLGIAEVAVRRRLRVAFFSTGDELRSLDQPLAPGCVYDSNRYTLHSMLVRLGCEPVDLGVVGDDPVLLEQALRSAAERADAILTSGGVSVGAADYTRELVERLGQCAFWSLAMRPGRPLAFGSIESNGKRALLFGLPGNPVAVMVSFYFFARDALLRMMGAQPEPLLPVRARAAAPMAKRSGRTEYQRGIASLDEQGSLQVSLTGAQGSGILSSMAAANCIVVLGHEQGPVQAGDLVEVILFDGLM